MRICLPAKGTEADCAAAALDPIANATRAAMLRFMKEFIRGSMRHALFHLRLGCLSLDMVADPLFAASG